jgi:hypothetical protein
VRYGCCIELLTYSSVAALARIQKNRPLRCSNVAIENVKRISIIIKLYSAHCTLVVIKEEGLHWQAVDGRVYCSAHPNTHNRIPTGPIWEKNTSKSLTPKDETTVRACAPLFIERQ